MSCLSHKGNMNSKDINGSIGTPAATDTDTVDAGRVLKGEGLNASWKTDIGRWNVVTEDLKPSHIL